MKTKLTHAQRKEQSAKYYACMGAATARMKQTGICDCGHPPTPQEPGSCTTGYGTLPNADYSYATTSCFECCALWDLQDMQNLPQGERKCLYFSKDREGRWKVGNWPGSLGDTIQLQSFSRKKNGHSWRGVQRTDVWFRVYYPNGETEEWWGVNLGDNDILRARPLKGTRKPAFVGPRLPFHGAYKP